MVHTSGRVVGDVSAKTTRDGPIPMRMGVTVCEKTFLKTGLFRSVHTPLLRRATQVEGGLTVTTTSVQGPDKPLNTPPNCCQLLNEFSVFTPDSVQTIGAPEGLIAKKPPLSSELSPVSMMPGTGCEMKFH